MSEFKIRAVRYFSDQTSLIVSIIILHALNFIHAFSNDCSIRVFCVQFTVSVCFIRVVCDCFIITLS